MKMILRLSLTLCLCVVFLALIGAISAGTRWGLPDYFYSHGLWHTLAISGGLACLIGALLAPGWSMKHRLVLALGGGILGAAAGAAAAFLITEFVEHELGAQIRVVTGVPAETQIRERSTSLAIIAVLTAWGVLLGAWLGFMHRTPFRGLLAGLLLVGSIATLGQFFENPDPASVTGAVGGLGATTLLCHAERRRRLLWVTRGVAIGLFVVTPCALVLLMPELWSQLGQYRLTGKDHIRTSICISPDGRQAIGRVYNRIYLWNVEDGRVINSLQTERDIISAVQYPSNENPYCVFINRQGILTRWNAYTGKQESRIIGRGLRPLDPERIWKNPFALALSPDGRRAAIIIPHEDPSLWVVDLEEWRQQEAALPTPFSVTALNWIDAERMLLACEGDGSVHVVRLANGRLQMLKSFTTPLVQHGRLSVSRNGEFACVVNPFRSPPCIIRLHDGEVQPAGGGGGKSGGVSTFSPDSRYLYWEDDASAIRVWDLDALREVRCYRQFRTIAGELIHIPSRFINSVAIRADGKVALSAHYDGQVRVWNLDHD